MRFAFWRRALSTICSGVASPGWVTAPRSLPPGRERSVVVLAEQALVGVESMVRKLPGEVWRGSECLGERDMVGWEREALPLARLGRAFGTGAGSATVILCT
jgi:hypothetical protein